MGGRRKADSEVVKVRMKLPIIKRCKDLQDTDSHFATEQFSTWLAYLCSRGADAVERCRELEKSDQAPRTGRRSPPAAKTGTDAT